eukprot:gnl/MRDRNA2_/MRDRNA2_107195_c0_seq1.p1 gnl/MRDRNA2_/MRDRNA2_107195_c0~~gnl/MRDRNA2_/MRDRNA2_107195_c0_seq1.p1  ORF type:complete len:721 (+),score=162.91 gnl/MRDRNA2_/MRDRNA2_107195_c0_seq1:66-2228(+)
MAGTGSGFISGRHDGSLTFSPAARGISSSAVIHDDSRSDLVATADLLHHRLQCAEVTLRDESSFWARERAVLVEKLRFAVEREEAKQQRLEVVMTELREQHDHSSRLQERWRAEGEETILNIKRECEHKLHTAYDERDKAVFDCENLAATLRSIEEDVDQKRSTWQHALDKSQDDHQRLTSEVKRWQLAHDEVRQELLRWDDLAADERRKFNTYRDDAERQAQLVLDEKTQEWNRQVQHVISEREEWRRQHRIMEGERDAWRDRHTTAESECSALARQIDSGRTQISKLEGRGRHEELEAEELRLRIDKCEVAQACMREHEAAMVREASDREQLLKQQINDAVHSRQYEQESMNAHCAQLVWRLEEAKAHDDFEAQKFVRLEREYESERKSVSRLEYELAEEQARARGSIERLEKEALHEMQVAADQHKRVVTDLEKRILNFEDRGLQLQRNASDAERQMQQALYVERELRAELRQKELAHQDQVLLMQEVMSDTKLLAKSLASHQKQASRLNETIRHSAEIVERSLSPRSRPSSPTHAASSPSRSLRATDAKSEDRLTESPSYGIHSNYVASLTAKYASDNAVNSLGRSKPAASNTEARHKLSERFSADRVSSQAILSTPLRASQSYSDKTASPMHYSPKRNADDSMGSLALRSIRFGEDSQITFNQRFPPEEVGLQGFLRGPRLGPDRSRKRQGPEVGDSWAPHLKGSSSTGSLRALV